MGSFKNPAFSQDLNINAISDVLNSFQLLKGLDRHAEGEEQQPTFNSQKPTKTTDTSNHPNTSTSPQTNAFSNFFFPKPLHPPTRPQDFPQHVLSLQTTSQKLPKTFKKCKKEKKQKFPCISKTPKPLRPAAGGTTSFRRLGCRASSAEFPRPLP